MTENFAGFREHAHLMCQILTRLCQSGFNDKSSLAYMHATGFSEATLNRAEMSFVEQRRADFTMLPT